MLVANGLDHQAGGYYIRDGKKKYSNLSKLWKIKIRKICCENLCQYYIANNLVCIKILIENHYEGDSCSVRCPESICCRVGTRLCLPLFRTLCFILFPVVLSSLFLVLYYLSFYPHLFFSFSVTLAAFHRNVPFKSTLTVAAAGAATQPRYTIYPVCNTRVHP